VKNVARRSRVPHRVSRRRTAVPRATTPALLRTRAPHMVPPLKPRALPLRPRACLWPSGHLTGNALATSSLLTKEKVSGFRIFFRVQIYILNSEQFFVRWVQSLAPSLLFQRPLKCHMYSVATASRSIISEKTLPSVLFKLKSRLSCSPTPAYTASCHPAAV